MRQPSTRATIYHFTHAEHDISITTFRPLLATRKRRAVSLPYVDSATMAGYISRGRAALALRLMRSHARRFVDRRLSITRQ